MINNCIIYRLRKHVVFSCMAIFISTAHSALTVNFTEDGADMLVTISGTLDLSGMTEGNATNSFGAAHSTNNNDQLQVGSGSDAPVNTWNQFDTVNSGLIDNTSGNFSATLVNWDAGNNTNSIRIQGNNGNILIDDQFGYSGDGLVDDDSFGTIVNIVGAQFRFAGVSYTTWNLAPVGTNEVWIANSLDPTNADSQIFLSVGTIPEPSSFALMAVGVLALSFRRKREFSAA